ncbi:MAG: TonB-dependent receptor [Rikenellaceae bacterium]
MKNLLLTYCIFVCHTLQAQGTLYGGVNSENTPPIAATLTCDNKASDLLTNNDIDTIIIRTRQPIETKSVVSAYTTSEQEIEQSAPRSISEMLESKSGFTNNSGYQSALSLRGLSSKRLIVLRNGTRRFSSYPSGFMSHTINVYDLERIEVEKGASSVIYGSGAIAGVINLVDRSPFEQSGFNAKITTGYSTVNSEKNVLASGGWSNGKFAGRVSLRYRDAENYTYPDGSVAENSFYTDKDAFITTGYKISEDQKIILTADFHNGGPWGKPLGYNGSDYTRVQTNDEISNNYALKYAISSSGLLSNTEFNIFYSDEKRDLVKSYYAAANYMLSYVETTHFADHYYGFNMKSLLEVNDWFSTTIGAESYFFNISTPVDAVDYIYEVSYSKRVSYNAHSLTSGIFAENRFKINRKLLSIVGLRFNYATINEGDAYSDLREPREQNKEAISGNFALKYRVDYNNLIKLNIAHSFRMPETTELYSDNFTSNGIVYANPDLLPEYCNSFDISYRFKSNLFELELSPFLWLMDNMVTKEELGGTVGTNYIYVNIGKSRIYGGEVNTELSVNQLFRPTDRITLQAGAAYLNGTDVTQSTNYWSEGTPLNYVPPLNFKANLHYGITTNNDIYLYLQARATYYTEQSRLGDDPYATPAYFLLGCNLGVDLPWRVSPKVNIAINNLLNREYYPYLSYIPAEGRDIRIFLTFNL